MNTKRPAFFDVRPEWEEHWKGMPSYDHRDLQSWRQIVVHFKNQADVDSFSLAIGQKVGREQRSLWYPPDEIGHFANKRFVAERPKNPRYPVYVISKGRWESRLTVRSLEKIGVPYRVVVEPGEYRNYARVIDRGNILRLPEDFSERGKGSIPVRNWVWEHAKDSGARRHWILDDNIDGFFRFQDNLKTPVGDGTVFRVAEDFADRYENVALAGFHYFMFVTRKSGRIPPFTLNTRIYSCILVDNALPYRWRGRYNEDTDLSLRVLKDGLCTVLFNAFLAFKQTTMTMKGGNTDELYQGDGRLRMAESLAKQHPGLVKVTRKWGRDQHHVDYRVFRKNKLVLRKDVKANGADDYGMTLEVRDPKRD